MWHDKNMQCFFNVCLFFGFFFFFKWNPDKIEFPQVNERLSTHSYLFHKIEKRVSTKRRRQKRQFRMIYCVDEQLLLYGCS